MNYLLDTCVLSEFTRKSPNKTVIQWVDSIDEEMLYISAITIGEIQRGIERLADSHRKTGLLVWLNTGLLTRFKQRILPIDVQTMLLWGSLTAQSDRSGQPMGIMDSLIGATAVQHNLIIASRNVTDFMPCGVQVINPWE